MHEAVTIDEAREIAGKFDIFRSVEQLAREVDRANQFLNQPFSAASRECCERSPLYMAHHEQGYRTGFTDPRDVLSYWYVQEQQEVHLEGLAATDFEERAYGIDYPSYT